MAEPGDASADQRVPVGGTLGAPGHHATKLGRSGYSDQVAKLLREAIVDGSLAVGAHLRETEIAEEMGTSRGPVRTALQVLVGEGLVRSLANGRVVVVGFDNDALEDLFENRFELERRAIHRGIARRSDAGPLRETASRLVATRSIMRIVDLDVHFHRDLVAFGGSRFLLQLWLSLAPVIHTVILVGWRTLLERESQELYTQIVESHGELIETLERGDADAATQMLAQHFDRSRWMFLNAPKSDLGEQASRIKTTSDAARSS